MSDFRIVLIETSHPGNIGATARAMKTMGLNSLYLVSPRVFPDQKANEMASGATDILENAKIFNTLDEAISDCTYVAGTSARMRSIPWPNHNPRTFAEELVLTEKQQHSKIAIVFGREQSGLTNDELQKCHCHIQIPSHPDYYSLNLAASVQIIAYELRMALLSKNKTDPLSSDYPPASVGAMEQFYEHLEKAMIHAKFLNPKAPRQLMPRLRKLFYRIQPDEMEINILRGLLKAFLKN